MMNYRNDITSEIRKTTSQEMKVVKIKPETDYTPLLLLAVAAVAIIVIMMIVL